MRGAGRRARGFREGQKYTQIKTNARALDSIDPIEKPEQKSSDNIILTESLKVSIFLSFPTVGKEIENIGTKYSIAQKRGHIYIFFFSPSSFDRRRAALSAWR